MDTNTKNRVMTAKEVADFLHVSNQVFQKKISKLIPRNKFGRSYIFQYDDVINFLNNTKTTGANDKH